MEEVLRRTDNCAPLDVLVQPDCQELGCSLVLVTLFLRTVAAADGQDSLERNFLTPPDSARPWVYWFLLDGNITREGITADLEAMARVGIGGVLYMETAQGTLTGPAAFAGPLWRSLFRHACQEAARLGLEVRTMTNSRKYRAMTKRRYAVQLHGTLTECRATRALGPLHHRGREG